MSCRDEMNVEKLARDRRACETRPTTEPPYGDLHPNRTIRGGHPEGCMCSDCRPSEG